MSKTVKVEFDPANLTLYTQENFYTPEDLACAAKNWPRQEVEEAFAIHRAAVAGGDHKTMAAQLSEDGRGGNSTFGLIDQPSYLRFLEDCFPEVIHNQSMWHVIDGGRIVERWCECLPGTPPGGGRYDYFGINELIYAGEGRFRLQYSIPDLYPLTVLYARWKGDGQHEIHGDIYPSL